MKRTPTGLPDLTNLDPAVAATLAQGAFQRRDRRQPKDQRRKQERERAKMEARNRIMVDIDPGLEEDLTILASMFNTSISGLVNLAVFHMMIDFEDLKFSPQPYLQPTKSPRGILQIVLDRDTPILTPGTPLENDDENPGTPL